MTSIEKQNQLLPTHPFAAQVSGPSGCGKTWWVKELLSDPDSPFDRVLYFYSIRQPLYDQMPRHTEFIEGLPDEVPEFDPAQNTAFVFDDLMDLVAKSRWAGKLYTAGCHHQNLSVISLQQKLFTNRDHRLQCHYLVVFDFPQDRGAMMPLARQLCPGNANKFLEIYRDATEPVNGWLLVDMKKNRDPRLRFRRGWRACYIENCDI